MGTEVPLSYDDIQTQLGFLQGKVLTVVEAALEGEKLVAVKSLIKKMFSEQTAHIGGLCYPRVHMMTRERVNETIGDVEKIEREAEPLYGLTPKGRAEANAVRIKSRKTQ